VIHQRTGALLRQTTCGGRGAGAERAERQPAAVAFDFEPESFVLAFEPESDEPESDEPESDELEVELEESDELDVVLSLVAGSFVEELDAVDELRLSFL
jgi:hypothetical protein